MRARKKQITKAKRVTVSVTNVSQDLAELLREDAKKHHRSLSGHVRALLEERLFYTPDGQAGCTPDTFCAEVQAR